MGELTRQQFCARMKISESTVRRLERDGMPYTPIGSRGKRYDLEECKRWLRERACQSGQTARGAGMSASWSPGNEFIASYRRRHLRVMPNSSKPKSEVA
jgi:phage terminase Nu1 subunit (DNA packaging protein)